MPKLDKNKKQTAYSSQYFYITFIGLRINPVGRVHKPMDYITFTMLMLYVIYRTFKKLIKKI